MTNKEKLTNKDRASNQLRSELLKAPTNQIYTKVTHVAKSGMSRSIAVYYVNPSFDIVDISWDVSQVLGYKRDEKNDGVKINGCGMDMCYSIVQELQRTLNINLNKRDL